MRVSGIWRLGLLLIVLGASALACAGPGDTKRVGMNATPRSTATFQESSPVETDAAVYYLTESPSQFDAYAVATYKNRTGRAVHFKRCNSDSEGPMYAIRRSGSDAERRSLVTAVWACVGGVPSGTLRPGDSLSARVWLGSMKSPNADPPDRPEDRIGRFQIDFLLCAAQVSDSDDCRLLPLSERQSNEFEIRFQ